ncbi:MBL fold metallo-hydrolase [Vibrio parahaemolyticus]|uniref:MBL fold metallo-hydrolase n=1 Tax=Vibrio parahaemolyticus TaxID=670 RepID=UPI00387B1A13
MLLVINPAGNGDSLILQSDETLVLVDGGTASSYPSWRDTAISCKRFDCVIATHIDNDHVNGLMKLLLDLDNTKIQIGECIYNGATQILGFEEVTSREEHEDEFNQLSASLEVPEDESAIAASEGTSLSYLISKLGIKTNSSALHTSNNPKFRIGNLNFNTISPNIETLSNLKSQWIEVLREDGIDHKVIGKAHKNAFEAYVKSLSDKYIKEEKISSRAKTVEELANFNYERDPSLANQSSLAFLVTDTNSSLLLLGDCHAESVLSWLDNNDMKEIQVDAVKLSHHGSKNNINKDLIERIKTEKYVISTNGKKHSHPNLEVLSLIAKYGKSSTKNIYINYSIDHIEESFIEELKKYSTHVHMATREIEL